MRLFYSPFHTFIHKVRVTAHEAGLWDDITFIATFPFKKSAGEDQGDAYSTARLNPLNSVAKPITRSAPPAGSGTAVKLAESPLANSIVNVLNASTLDPRSASAYSVA